MSSKSRLILNPARSRPLTGHPGALAVHDAALSAIGVALVGGLLGDRGPGVGTTYSRLEPLASTEL